VLVHEGGFEIERDASGAIHFRRPDGRVIPRFGYRLDDMRDDFAASENAEHNELEHAENPSMEVRETAAAYHVRGPLRAVARRQCCA
jgi:hypothetical protein